MTQVTYATIAEEVKGQCASEAQETLQAKHTAKELRAVAIEIARHYCGWTTSEYHSMKKAELADAIVIELVRKDVCFKDSERPINEEELALTEQQETNYAEVKVSEVMEQLKAVRTDRQAQRAILRRCPVNFLKEMCEVVYLHNARGFQGIQPGHEKECYLDLLTAVSDEDLPLARFERDVHARKDWLVTREVEREYLAEWQEYMNVPYKGYGVVETEAITAPSQGEALADDNPRNGSAEIKEGESALTEQQETDYAKIFEEGLAYSDFKIAYREFEKAVKEFHATDTEYEIVSKWDFRECGVIQYRHAWRQSGYAKKERKAYRLYRLRSFQNHMRWKELEAMRNSIVERGLQARKKCEELSEKYGFEFQY